MDPKIGNLICIWLNDYRNEILEIIDYDEDYIYFDDDSYIGWDEWYDFCRLGYATLYY